MITKQATDIKPGDLIYSVFDNVLIVLENRFMGIKSYYNGYIGVYKLTCLCKGNIIHLAPNSDKCYTLLNDRS